MALIVNCVLEAIATRRALLLVQGRDTMACPPVWVAAHGSGVIVPLQGLWWLPTAEDAAARSGDARGTALQGGEGGAELLRLVRGSYGQCRTRRL